MSSDNPNWTEIIDLVSREKGIPRKIFIEALEEAILRAAKKVFGEGRQFEAAFNTDIGQVELFQYMQVVEEVDNPNIQLNLETAHKVDPEVQIGDELGFQIFYLAADSDKAREGFQKFGDVLNIDTHRRSFGRIAAQTAKHVVLQKVQDAERIIIYDEYKDRKGELVSGVARRFEKSSVIVDLGKAEAILPLKEQCPRESYRPGDRVQAFVKDVNKEAKGHQIILSRTDPRFVVKLFEKEVPEIYEGIVKVAGVAREPGERTKLAVTSTDSDVDPVGACVGMKGSRVQAVVQELRGEKIDIIPYSVDVPRYVCAAIAPAVVQRVLVDETNHQIELIVADDQLSLAIGRRGQNVKLATKLLGWDIEIHGESRIAELKNRLKAELVKLEGLDESTIEYLFKLGYHAPDNLLNADEAELAAIPGVGATLAQGIQQVAYELKQTLKQEQLNAATAEGSTAEKAEEGLTETPVRNGSDTTEEEMA
ncbi:transcription termination factor NusA [Myxococcota bacterium]|jgi:N utilization substance protein A|nr:transcription termination factor NusA [Myxococcota bacterium]HHW95773.1 transcription termination factor NusA [Oligoflexales bacterium]